MLNEHKLEFISCTLLMVTFLWNPSNGSMQGSRTLVKHSYGITEDFQAEIPQDYRKIGSKYYFIDNSETLNWFQAAAKCRRHQGNLMNIQNEIEFNNINESLNITRMYWTDLNNLVNKTVLYSLSTGTEGSYKKNYNNGKDFYCAVLRHAGKELKLQVMNCFRKSYTICETNTPTKLDIIVH